MATSSLRSEIAVWRPGEADSGASCFSSRQRPETNPTSRGARAGVTVLLLPSQARYLAMVCSFSRHLPRSCQAPFKSRERTPSRLPQRRFPRHDCEAENGEQGAVSLLIRKVIHWTFDLSPVGILRVITRLHRLSIVPYRNTHLRLERGCEVTGPGRLSLGVRWPHTRFLPSQMVASSTSRITVEGKFGVYSGFTVFVHEGPLCPWAVVTSTRDSISPAFISSRSVGVCR